MSTAEKILVVCLLLFIYSIGLFLIIYGVRAGLVKKRIIKNTIRDSYITGPAAVVRGWFYIATGAIGFLVATLAALHTSW